MNKIHTLYTKAVPMWLIIAVVLFCMQTIALYANNRMREYNKIGLAYAEQGKYDKAIAEYTQAMALYTKRVRTINRGKAYEKQGKQTQAEEDFAKAKQLRRKQ